MLLREMLSHGEGKGGNIRMEGVGQGCVLVLPTVGRSRDMGTSVKPLYAMVRGGWYSQSGDLGSR